MKILKSGDAVLAKRTGNVYIARTAFAKSKSKNIEKTLVLGRIQVNRFMGRGYVKVWRLLLRSPANTSGHGSLTLANCQKWQINPEYVGINFCYADEKSVKFIKTPCGLCI